MELAAVVVSEGRQGALTLYLLKRYAYPASSPLESSPALMPRVTSLRRQRMLREFDRTPIAPNWASTPLVFPTAKLLLEVSSPVPWRPAAAVSLQQSSFCSASLHSMFSSNLPPHSLLCRRVRLPLPDSLPQLTFKCHRSTLLL